jgi:bisphosphoglycerate-independent phosphoglycerate mutase (AlkP superfamily)
MVGNGRVDETNPLRRGDRWVRSTKINQARGRVLQSHDVVVPIRFRRAKESPISKVLFNQVFDEV